MLIGKEQIARLIPHSGAMCLLERVTHWDQHSIHCTAISHCDPANPLRRGDRLSAICAVEYASQAMAVHGALRSGECERQRPGYLASLRDVACFARHLDFADGELQIVAELLLSQGSRVMYAFRVRCAHSAVVSGRAAIVLGTPHDR